MRTVAALLAATALMASACTNVLVTPGASIDGSAFLTYNADSSSLMGTMNYAKAAKWPANSTREVYDWDTGVYLGKIAQATETYTVVGNMNEYQLAITETTFGGREELEHQKGAVVDYGSLIYIALERSKNAREAIKVMTDLVAQYGYYSEGESFSIADPKEVWIMEMIGKGDFEKGAVWVARRVPDGYICSHANQARITTFPRNDPENCLYSADVVSFAKKHGFYAADASEEAFSFSDVYAPLTFLNVRACEGRVWSVFRRVMAPGAVDMYVDYILGHNMSHRMPLWVVPAKKLSVNDTMMLMRDHYEGTLLDFTTDVGAEAFGAPYRRTLQFSHKGKTYLNERAISVIQTGFAIVTQSRAWMPRQLGGIIWFAVDDSATTVYFPMYSAATRAPASYTGGDIMDADFNKAWWAFSLLANFVYPRWSLVYPEVWTKIDSIEAKYLQEVPQIDAKALSMFQKTPDKALEFVTDYSVKTGDSLVKEWNAFFRTLFAKYLDIYVKTARPGQKPAIASPGYTDAWKERIVKDAGDRYIMPDESARSARKVPKWMM